MNVDSDDRYLLGFDPVDDAHKEFHAVVSSLLTCTKGTATASLAALEAHLETHFGLEETWMLDTAFPPRQCHIDEHAAVLRSVRDVRGKWMGGGLDVDTLRVLALHLVQWFPGHADHMDSALVAWISKGRHGGKPVVLKRNLRFEA